MTTRDAPVKIVPAQLSFLAIYNPSLGTTDETFRDQVVFYYSRAARARRKGTSHRDDDGDVAKTEDEVREEENEKLRQIGLAQGMVDFARSFSSGEAMDSVETEKSRIVLKEVETGWWILASIDLTRLPTISSPPAKSGGSSSTESKPSVEYSSREVSPPDLLIQQLLRAHHIFCLHHGPSLTNLYTRIQRPRFCSTLDRYWLHFATDWDVLLHGNPAVGMYRSVKLASGGELGIGVGEEEWGSGERDVFEDFVSRTDGLVDMVVSRFGDPRVGEANPDQIPRENNTVKGKKAKSTAEQITEPWMGTSKHPGPSDGVVFSGVGAISRKSLTSVTDWIRSVYSHGEFAYGVKENPTSERRSRRREGIRSPTPEPQIQRESQNGHSRTAQRGAIASTRERPMIPPPIVAAAEQSLDKALIAAEAGQNGGNGRPAQSQDLPGDENQWTKYLTLGYGSAWGLGSNRPQSRAPSQVRPAQRRTPTRESGTNEPCMQHVGPESESRRLENRINTQINAENCGHFSIGLKGDMTEDFDDASPSDEKGTEPNIRIMIRMLHVEISNPAAPLRQMSSASSHSEGILKHTKMRVVLYVHRPFIYAFLFDPRTDSLALPSFYRNLHTFFAPLHRPLSNSTDPAKVASRIAAAASQTLTTGPSNPIVAEQQPIFDLIYDPGKMTLHTSVPNIPTPGALGASGLTLPNDSGSLPSTWTRVEALSVHSQILNLICATRQADAQRDIERSAKTSRGWWVVWMRLSAAHSDEQESADADTEQEGDGEMPSAHIRDSAAPTGSEYLSHLQPPPLNPDDADDQLKMPPALPREVILIRRARDATSSSGSKSGAQSTSGMWSLGLGGGGTTTLRGNSSREDLTGGSAAGWGPARLAEGIGVDARKYVEGLLSLNW